MSDEYGVAGRTIGASGAPVSQVISVIPRETGNEHSIPSPITLSSCDVTQAIALCNMVQ